MRWRLSCIIVVCTEPIANTLRFGVMTGCTRLCGKQICLLNQTNYQLYFKQLHNDLSFTDKIHDLKQ